ncbi:hypothetical protein Trydic_g22348 [Trypoxylus dichotomus]
MRTGRPTSKHLAAIRSQPHSQRHNQSCTLLEYTYIRSTGSETNPTTNAGADNRIRSGRTDGRVGIRIRTPAAVPKSPPNPQSNNKPQKLKYYT